MFAYVVMSLIIFTVTFWAWTYRTHLKLSWQMPGLFPSVPLVGILWRFFVQENLEAIDTALKQHDNSEVPVGMWVGPKFVIYVDNTRDVETLLTSPNCVRDKMYRYIKDMSGVDGMFTLDSEISRKHRRLASPSFSEKVVLSYVTKFARLSSDLIKDLKKMVDNEPFDIRPCISDCTLNAFVDAIYGLDDITADERITFHRNMKLGQSLVGKRFFLPWFRSDWIWRVSGHLKLAETIVTSTNEIIVKGVQKVIDRQCSDNTFLDRMVRVSDETDDFTIKDVIAEAITTFIAGTDTSSAAISYTVLLLAMHPEHQERVFEELKIILPSKDTTICSEHIHQMTYLELCIKESLRLFPVVSLMAKQVKYGTINLGGHEVGPGVSILIGVNRLHRKLKYWGADANAFNPTRFLPKNFSKINRFAYIPFSDGSRNCVGYKYAYVVMKSILANILRNYRLTSPLKLDELRIKLGKLKSFLETF